MGDIHELFRRVREHPDFVFGTIFVRADLEGDEEDERDAIDPGTFPAKFAEDFLATQGNELIRDLGTPVRVTGTGHVVGATYRSSYWGGVYRVVGPHGECGVEVECIEPGAGAHQTVGEHWTHLTALDPRDKRLF